ncbi:probable E3 ubiquitin-protein ligase RNF25 [Coccomyxa sp. Obi]|nr:probable E3 ubiquitin-protein ligase RNF25 [Coccomyxa sp. Obi]
MSFEETTSTEIEALEYTYGTSFRVLSSDPLNVSVAVEPFTGEDNTRMYVYAELFISVGKRYPDQVPEIDLRNAKGMNSPEDDCIFCMNSLSDEASTPGSQELIKLPCYHCFHLDCFARWWRWEQRSLHTKRKRIIEELSAAAGPKLHSSGLIPTDQGLFTILCPSCRAKVTPEDLAHVMPQLMPRKGTAEAEALSSEEHQASSRGVDLPEDQMAHLRQMQQRNARLFAAQKRKNGIVEDSWSVSLGQQPSQSADERSGGSDPAQDAPSASGRRAPKSDTGGAHQGLPAAAEGRQQRGSRRRHGEERSGDLGLESMVRRRQQGKGGRPQGPRSREAEQGVRDLSRLQIADNGIQRSCTGARTE